MACPGAPAPYPGPLTVPGAGCTVWAFNVWPLRFPRRSGLFFGGGRQDTMDSPKQPPVPEPPHDEDGRPRIRTKLRKVLVGPPRDLLDRKLYSHISLIAFLAWVGLGADGLSSSAYGPAEAFRTLGEHTYLAI